MGDVPTESRKFTEQDELRWHQLDLLRRILPPSGESGSGNQSAAVGTPSREWGLGEQVDLYAWQAAALEAWESNGRTGVVKVVTGAGKTMLALGCIERWLREDAENRVSVVVPTRVLLDQWQQELVGTLGLPEAWVGRRSGDYKDSFGDDGRRVMIYVVNSARTALGRPLSAEQLGANHFLVVDECHRAGSSENRRIFKAPRRISLGLSATPERDLEATDDLDDRGGDVPDVVRRELGPIIYELTFREALKEGIVPPFELIQVAVELTRKERQAYAGLDRELKDVRSRLRREPPFIRGRSRVPNEFQLIKALARRGESSTQRLAARYEALVSKRKELLYRAHNRIECFESILQEERLGVAGKPRDKRAKQGARESDLDRRSASDVRVMVFHERITEINRLFDRLVRAGEPVVVDHTGMTESQRERSLDLYLRGTAPILLSVKALIEGVNAPATDIGVIVAASTSPRQKIQSMGRVMRKYRGKETSRIYNLYVADTVDDAVFRRMDFEAILGVGRVGYRRWLGPGQWREEEGPPHTPPQADWELDENALVVGEPYPGAGDGVRLSLDTQGNVFRPAAGGGASSREFGGLPSAVLDAIERIRPGGGAIRVTERRHHVLVPRRLAGGGWEVIYAGRLDGPMQWQRASEGRVQIKVSGKFAAYGGSIVVGKSYDYSSLAAKRIKKLVRAFRAEGIVPVHKVELDRCGYLYVRVRGKEHRLGRLRESVGWPMGASSYADLARGGHTQR